MLQRNLIYTGLTRAKKLAILVGTKKALGLAIRRGLAPITIGLMFSGATILLRAVNHDWRGYLISLLTVAVVLRKSWNPLLLLGAGALAGLFGFV